MTRCSEQLPDFATRADPSPISIMFPQLEKTFLGLLAKAARPDGYIPHDLGLNSFDHATDGTTSPPGWKDLGPSFILLVFRVLQVYEGRPVPPRDVSRDVEDSAVGPEAGQGW